MGRTFRGDVRHLISSGLVAVEPDGGVALCGATLTRLVRNWSTQALVEYGPHWENQTGTSIGDDACTRCVALYERTK